MKSKIILLFFCFIFTDHICQVSSEGMAMFDFEIEKLILNKDRNLYKEIKIILRPHQLSYSKKWKDIVKYKIINDSIIKQTLQRSNYYGLISNGEIINIDYSEKSKKILKKDKIETDSLTYKVSKYFYASGKDTSYFHSVKKLDTNGNISTIQYTSYDNNYTHTPVLTKIEINNDTAYCSKYYELKDRKWVLKREWIKTTHKKSNYYEVITKSKSIDKDNTEKTGIDNTKIYYTYDSNHRLTSIYKENYDVDFKDIYDIHQMTITYKNK